MQEDRFHPCTISNGDSHELIALAQMRMPFGTHKGKLLIDLPEHYVVWMSGVQLGILTRNDRDIALQTLETIGMGHYFTEKNVLGRSEVPPKPDPAGIHYLLSEWGAAPSGAVMVGDYLFDLQAGRAAGITTVHVGRPDGKAWLEYTDYEVATLNELLELYAIVP